MKPSMLKRIEGTPAQQRAMAIRAIATRILQDKRKAKEQGDAERG